MIDTVEAGTVRPVVLWYGDFASGEVRVCSHNRDVTWDGETWTGLGDFIGLESITETRGSRANGVAFILNGVPSDKVALALAAGFRRRRCIFYLGFFDEDYAVIEDPIAWSFLMDRMPIRDGEKDARIVVYAEPRSADLQRANERRLNHEDQQALFAGDLGFGYVAALQNKEIVVGGSSSSPATGSSARGSQPLTPEAAR